eukprot:5445342-Pleurochrysis_carterae.AAC.1
MGIARCRTSGSLIGTTETRAHSNPLLACDACIQRMEAHVMSRSGSNGRVCGRPSSPARNNRLCASSAAAHSTTPLGDVRS